MFKNAVEIFDLFGFKVRVDPSWLLIAALIVWSLSSAYFPQVLPGYAYVTYVTLGVVAMLGLFLSLILHELSHSLVARQFDLKVGSITLFIFGGVAELEHEPRDPKSEFWIAVAGPALSYALAAFFLGTAAVLAAVDAAKPIKVVFDYLVLVNFILATFNLVPAFPLDGGRIFRAVLWHFTGNIFPATRIASAFGTAFGFVLIISGVFSIFTTGSFTGLWQILIGYFIVNASRGSYQHLLVSSALKEQTVERLMTRPVYSADAEDMIQSVVEDVILARNVTFVPVLEGDRLLGYASMSALKGVERDEWAKTKLRDVLIPAGPENTVRTDTPMDDVFSKMTQHDQRKLMVAEDGRLLGIVALSDLMTYLAIRNGLLNEGGVARGRKTQPDIASAAKNPSGA